MRDVNNSYKKIRYNEANPLIPNTCMLGLKFFRIGGIMRAVVGACISLKWPSVRGEGMGAPLIILLHREFKQLSINARTLSIDEYFLTIIMSTFAKKNLVKIDEKWLIF